jgi:hypothetical protein
LQRKDKMMRGLKAICLLASFSFAVAGCNSTQRAYCPALKNYSAADMKKLATEFSRLPAEARAMVDDYALMRRECRAIVK